MKKSTIIALCFIGIGLILILCSRKVPGNKSASSMSSDDSFTQMQYVCEHEINSINLEDTSNAIVVKVDNVDKPVIDYYIKDGNLEYNISEKNGSLNFERKDNLNFSVSIGINFFEPTVTLTLPKNYSGDLSVKVSSGSIKMDDAKTDDLSIRCSSGSIALNNIDAGNIVLDATSGTIKLNNIVSKDSILSECSSGSVRFDNVTAASSITSNSTSGNTTFNNTSAKETSIYCSSGSIRFDNLTADSIKFKSTSGFIKGSINGDESDYSIISDVTSGSCNLDDKRDGAKMLDAKTSSGSINIEFNK